MGFPGGGHLASFAPCRRRHTCYIVSRAVGIERGRSWIRSVREPEVLSGERLLIWRSIALFWATGAINHLTQFAASALAAKLSSGTIATSCFVSTAFILAAYVVIARCKINCRVAMIRVAGEEDEHLNAQDTSLARLIPASLQDSTTRPWTALALNRSLLTTTFSLSLIGVAKAASPFFGLYVRQKFDFSFSKVRQLSAFFPDYADTFPSRLMSSRGLS